METIMKRLRRGDDLMLSIRRLCSEHGVKAGVILAAPGCLSRYTLRDADGVTVRDGTEACEIVSLTGTVSEKRCHVHIGLSRQGMGAFGGHLMEGCIVNTTCELVILSLEGWEYGVVEDEETGYDEIEFRRV